MSKNQKGTPPKQSPSKPSQSSQPTNPKPNGSGVGNTDKGALGTRGHGGIPPGKKKN